MYSFLVYPLLSSRQTVHGCGMGSSKSLLSVSPQFGDYRRVPVYLNLPHKCYDLNIIPGDSTANILLTEPSPRLLGPTILVLKEKGILTVYGFMELHLETRIAQPHPLFYKARNENESPGE